MARAGYGGRGIHGTVVDELGRRVAAGQPAPGAGLPREDEVAREFAVSRTVVREAIRVLAAKGMLAARPMAGTRVRPRRDWHLLDPDVLGWIARSGDAADILRDLVEVRRIVEPPVARLAAQRAGGRLGPGLGPAWSAMVDAVADPGRFLAADLAFHTALLALAGNAMLEQLSGAIGAELRLCRELQSGGTEASPRRPAESLGLHRRVMVAIERGDGVAAERAMAEVVAGATRDAERALAIDRRRTARATPLAAVAESARPGRPR
ncbi:MAG TPA: FCD domain-containing protein [Candidatus Limnocylindrales bacterium]